MIKGGLLSGINLTHTCSGCSECGSTLDPGMIKTEGTRESGIIIGLGNIEISVLAWAKNAEEVNVQLNGFVFGPLVIL